MAQVQSLACILLGGGEPGGTEPARRDLLLPRNRLRGCTVLEVKSLEVTHSHVQPFAASQPVRLLCPWHFPGKNTAVGCHFLALLIMTKASLKILVEIFV